MTEYKNRTMRFTIPQWMALRAEAELRGYSGPNAMIQAIADGALPIGIEPPKLNTYATRLNRIEGELDGVWVAIEELRQIVAGLPPAGPTDLP
jgi:hypothetical protein